MITVLNGGVATAHPSTFRMSRPKGLHNYVILIVRSEGEFLIDQNAFTVTPGHAVILTPGTPYYYSNPNGTYMDDWIHFTLSPCTTLSDKLPINTPFLLSNTELFTFLIKQMLWEQSYCDPMLRKETIDALFLILCNHLIMAAKKTAPDQTLSMPYQEQLQFIRLNLSSELPNRPTIENYAAKLGISSSYFQHLYTKTFGISFQKNLIRIRVEQAKYYLTTTDLTLSQIAEVCGYTNEVHFYQQFKQSTRMTPARFRKGGV